MQITLNVSAVELATLRAALADYACLAYREGRKRPVAFPAESRGWSAAEVAAVDVLSRLPAGFSAPARVRAAA